MQAQQAFQPAARTDASSGLKQEPVLHFGDQMMVPAQGDIRNELEQQSKAGACTHVTTHGGHHFLAPGGNSKKGVVEIVPAAVPGAAPLATWYWVPSPPSTPAEPS